MRWRLRQVTALVGDLDAAVAAVKDELGLSMSLRDDGTTAAASGISNAWFPLGSSILEVASPARPGDATARFYERYGDGGYMVILQTDSLDAARERLRATETRITRELDYPDAKELHLDHRDVGGTILAVDWADPPGSWRWAGPDWPAHVRTHSVTELLCAEVRTPDPETTAERWGELLGRPRRAPATCGRSTSTAASSGSSRPAVTATGGWLALRSGLRLASPRVR